MPEPIVPSLAVYSMDIRKLFAIIRERMDMKLSSVHAGSVNLRQRELAKKFEYFVSIF
jgi:hypothetical protein